VDGAKPKLATWFAPIERFFNVDNTRLQEIANNALMGIEPAAAYLDVHPKFIRERCSDKWQGVRIPSYRIAGRLKFKKSDLDDWINFHKNEGRDAK
jgi:hypothetical protein